MSTLIEQQAGLAIGTVESVSPNEIRVILDPEAPQTTALNTGMPTGFPRINSYVLVPNETGAVVGLIAWLGVERSAFPKRTGLKDFGLVDLPFPLRKMSLTPVGTLTVGKDRASGDYEYRLERGVSVFPSVGDQVLLPTDEQVHSIVEAQGTNLRVEIGISPLAGNAAVSVDPNKLFGRHLAVLGNTGSGKSCSLAGLIRWSLEKAGAERSRAGRGGQVNARFIILDPNGEYLETFSDLGNRVRVFRVAPETPSHLPLQLPAWMWNSGEWCAFASATAQTQRPLLLQALRDMRASETVREPAEIQARRLMISYKAKLEQMIAQGVGAYTGFPAKKDCGTLLRNLETDSSKHAEKTDEAVRAELTNLSQIVKAIANSRSWTTERGTGFNDFSDTDLRTVLAAMDRVVDALPKPASSAGPSEDAPKPFEVEELPNHVEFLATGEGASQFVATLTMRIRMMLADRRLGPLLVPKAQVSFSQWLEDYIGSDEAGNGQVAILDLSLVPSDVLHVVIAVIARIIFEATQRYRKIHGEELPTILVLEEAHTFIQRMLSEETGPPSAAQMCRNTFERIAREGRKFGLGLVLSSQRPSELSATVLAQCNTFLLHRIVNDRDQELVSKLVPDVLGGLLKELPSLPTRQAILLGWATPLPVLVEIKDLPESQRPRSADPKFWEVWTGEEERPIDWDEIVDDWIS
jgi:hypothetical protein